MFAGGCTLESAEAVCDSARDSILDGLESLVDMSLLRRAAIGDGLRFQMLETVREYGLEQLGDGDRAARVRRAHAEHYLDFAERAGQMLRGS